MITSKALSRAAILAPVISLAACSSIQRNDDNQPSCQGDAHYQVSYESVWSPETFPNEYPAKAHYSVLVGATHRPDVSIWAQDQRASAAIKEVAEKGQDFKLKKQINWLVKIDKGGTYIEAPDLKTGTGVVDTSFTANPDFPNVSLLTMIAPSPDWFVGVSSLALCVNGEWLEEYQEDLYAIDGGTDSGLNYAYATEETATNPVGVIQPVINERLGIHPSKTFGTIRFTKIGDSDDS